MDEFTKEQKAQLKTWAEQRDELLLEISGLKTSEEKLRSINTELASSNSDIESRMLIIQGRIEELKIKESELPLVISKEIALLESKKTSLQTEIEVTIKLLDILKAQKAPLESDIEKALSIFEVIKGESLLLEKINDKVATVSQGNAEKINSLVSNLAVSLEEIISVNRKNVLETNIVIEKLPAMMMELQKAGLLKTRETLIKIKE